MPLMIDEYVHYYARGRRLCALRTGTDSPVYLYVTCPGCRLLADPPPALDDVAAIEEWLSA